MRGAAQRSLVLLLVAVSLLLTGLTLWAVSAQGRALQARDWADLRNSAAAAAAERHSAWRADAERALVHAGRALEAGGADEFDAWISGRADWLLACSSTCGEAWVVHPRTPLEEPLPEVAAAPAPDSAPTSPELEAGGRDLLSTLRDLQYQALSPDPLTRSGALLAMAACEQQLGHPLAAARIFADAAQLLRSTPRLARFAFRAELARIDSLWAAGDRERARATAAAFLGGLLADHPARLGPAEAERLQAQTELLALSVEDPVSVALAEVCNRAARRAAVVEVVLDVLGARAGAEEAEPRRGEFLYAVTAAGEPLVLTVGAVSRDFEIALVAPAADVLARYWRAGDGERSWRVRLPQMPAEPGVMPLLDLGPEFGCALIEPTAAKTAALRATARRRMGFVLATGTGMAAAWALVIWVMLRVVARQRELARLQGRFVADVSHELKTPLALIRLLSETLASRRVRDPERIHAYHETITREAERLSVLLDNILDLGRIESERKQYEFRACDIAAVARQAWTLFEPQFQSEGFEARLELAPGLPVVRADAQALQQVLVNLLQNAYRYAGERKFVRLAVSREGYVIVMVVEDHGIGMSRNQLDRLGESFFRADDTRVRQTRGVGLGLAIVNHIVTAHRGKIEVQSRPGQGSTFTVWIPFEPAEERPQ